MQSKLPLPVLYVKREIIMYESIVFTVHPGDAMPAPSYSRDYIYESWSYKAVPEIPVRTTVDGVPVVHALKTTKHSCNNADFEIAKTSYKDLKKLSLCSGDGKNHHISSLEDISKDLKVDRDRKLIIRLKDSNALKLVKDILEKNDVESQVFFRCDEYLHCKQLKETCPKAKTMFFAENKDPKLEQLKHVDYVVYSQDKLVDGVDRKNLGNTKTGMTIEDNIDHSILEKNSVEHMAFKSIDDLKKFKKK